MSKGAQLIDLIRKIANNNYDSIRDELEAAQHLLACASNTIISTAENPVVFKDASNTGNFLEVNDTVKVSFTAGELSHAKFIGLDEQGNQQFTILSNIKTNE